jgi:hypothetical protein
LVVQIVHNSFVVVVSHTTNVVSHVLTYTGPGKTTVENLQKNDNKVKERTERKRQCGLLSKFNRFEDDHLFISQSCHG